MKLRTPIVGLGSSAVLLVSIAACSSPDSGSSEYTSATSAELSVVQRIAFPSCQIKPSSVQAAKLEGWPVKPVVWDGGEPLWAPVDVELRDIPIHTELAPELVESAFADVHDIIAIRRSTSEVIGRAFVRTPALACFEAKHGQLVPGRGLSTMSAKLPTGPDPDKCTRDGCWVAMVVHSPEFTGCEIEQLMAEPAQAAPAAWRCQVHSAQSIFVP